jgi:predicted dehydrogenase
VKTVKLGVVGVGHLGRHHARIYRAMKAAELVGIVDRDEATARAVAKKVKTEWSVDLDLLLDRAEAVSIAVPTVAHHEVALAFLKKGISVLVEKPMTFSVAEAEEMVEIAAANGAKLQVGHIERFNPGFQAIAEHGLKPVFIECDRLSPFRFRSADIGVVFDLMIHDLDIIQSLVPSAIERIDAVGVPVISEHEDIANARIVFENGCVANLTASRVSLKTLRKIRIFAPNAYVAIDTQAGEARVYKKKADFDEVARKLKGASNLAMLGEMRKLVYGDLVSVDKIKLGKVEPLQAELESFVAAVRDDREPEVTGRDGVKAVRVATEVVTLLKRHLAETGLDLRATLSEE